MLGWVAAMTRMTWTIFGLILMMVIGAAVMRVVATREEDRAAASGGVGNTATGGGEGVSKEMDMEATGDVGGDDRGVGCGARLVVGEASDIRGGSDSTFQDLLELSSRSHLSRLHQGTIFEMFETKRGRYRQSGEGTSTPGIEEEELGSNDDDDDDDVDYDMEAEASGEEEGKEEKEAEAEEQEVGVQKQPAQVRHGEKRRRIHEGIGIAGWSTLQANGPLEGYRHRPTAMGRFCTIRSSQVHTDSLK